MSSDRIFHFQIGGLVVCAEDSHGYAAPAMPDAVTLAVRERTSKGKIGARKAVSFYAHRNEIAAIGLEFLALAHRMAPETLWARSETVQSRPAQKPVKWMLQDEARKIADALEKKQLGVEKPLACFENLRQRIHILQRAQYLLERVDGQVAQQLDLLLAMLEHHGALPFTLNIMPGELDEASPHCDGVH